MHFFVDDSHNRTTCRCVDREINAIFPRYRKSHCILLLQCALSVIKCHSLTASIHSIITTFSSQRTHIKVVTVVH